MNQHLELESLGILRQTKLPSELAWMSDAEKQLVLMVQLAGEGGLHKRDVTKLSKHNPDMLLNLDARGLVQWDTDKSGRPVFLVLTWKGDEIAQLLLHVAKHESRKQLSPQKETRSDR